MAFALKAVGQELYNAKVPYTYEECKNNFLTNDKKRIAVYKYKGVAKNRLRDLQATCTYQLEIVEYN